MRGVGSESEEGGRGKKAFFFFFFLLCISFQLQLQVPGSAVHLFANLATVGRCRSAGVTVQVLSVTSGKVEGGGATS